MGVFAFHRVWVRIQVWLREWNLFLGQRGKQRVAGQVGCGLYTTLSFLLTWSLVLQAVDITEIPRKAPDGPFLLQSPSQSSKVSALTVVCLGNESLASAPSGIAQPVKTQGPWLALASPGEPCFRGEVPWSLPKSLGSWSWAMGCPGLPAAFSHEIGCLAYDGFSSTCWRCEDVTVRPTSLSLGLGKRDEVLKLCG